MCYKMLVSVDAVVCLDVLAQHADTLIVEIQGLKEGHELAINALNVAHEVEVESLSERFEKQLASQLAAGKPHCG